MKTTVGKLLDAQAAFTRLAACNLTIRLSFKVSRVMAKFADDFKAADAQRTNLLQKYGESVPGGYRLPPHNVEAFQKEFEPLALTEVDIPVEPLKLSEFDDTVKISPADASALTGFIVE